MKRLIFFLIFCMVVCIDLGFGGSLRTSDVRLALYIPSTHWDREWYEPFQGYRMRLVSLLDEVLDTLAKDPEFKSFFMDGQVAPVFDYLEIQPDKKEALLGFIRDGRITVGPWFDQPDEWVVSGESIVRNLQLGQRLAGELGAPLTRAAFACDQFGHLGQLPQIFRQMDLSLGLLWRGTLEQELAGHFNWKAPDGTVLPVYRFGHTGYCTYALRVRRPQVLEDFDFEAMLERLVEYVLYEAARSHLDPILLFDGCDHMEIEPRTSELIARANEKLKSDGIKIIHSTMDDYIREVMQRREEITKSKSGELRESSRDPGAIDEQWLIPGVLSSRIPLKQMNARCEDEMCLWAEPFSAFVAPMGIFMSEGFFKKAWRYILLNHPHDSMGGCSIDQVHKDMEYRFDQALGIASRLTDKTLSAIARAATPDDFQDGLLIAVFNSTAEDIRDAVDIDIPLPTDWPTTFQEFFGYEQKFSFKLFNPGGEEVPYQLVAQQRDRMGFHRYRYHVPQGDPRHVVSVTAPLKIPAYGYTTLIVKPVEGPTRYSGSMITSPRTIENEFLKVQLEADGSLTLFDKENDRTYSQLLIFEDRADIGDGWFHGPAVNDQVCVSSSAGADVALVADGIGKATLRVIVTMHVPESFDFRINRRSETTRPLRICSDVTLRKNSRQVEVTTVVDNDILDHRLRVLFPTNLMADMYYSDSAYDVVERPIALKADNDIRRELDVETRPQISWTALHGGRNGLAVVSRGLPESAVIDRADRPIALTLLRSFRRAVFSNDNPGGQIQGQHRFRYAILPFGQRLPRKELFLLGQRILNQTRTADVLQRDIAFSGRGTVLPREMSFLHIEGQVVVTAILEEARKMKIRLFNPYSEKTDVLIRPHRDFRNARSVTLAGHDDAVSKVITDRDTIRATVPGKRICTIEIE